MERIESGTGARRALAASLLAACLGSAHASAAAPQDIDGLVAWYAADSLSGKLDGGAEVRVWPDLSGNGHDLTDDRNGLPALLQAAQVHRKPAVEIRKANTFSVTEPFDLGEHTILLVSMTGINDRALFRDAARASRGVLLRAGGSHDRYQSGPRPEQMKLYGTATAPAGAYAVTVLGRRAGRLKAYVNGENVSTDAELTDTISVGKFFHVKQTQFSSVDGGGLWIAELLFYDRYLADAERDALTRHLANKYAIAVELPEPVRAPTAAQPRPDPGIVVLSTTSTANVNGAGVAVSWNLQDELSGPFRHDPQSESTRVYATRDGIRARLSVSLPLTAAADGVNVRATFRLNGAKWLRGQGNSGPLGSGEGRNRGTVRAETVATLDEGDYVEVITLRDGAPGEVVVDPEQALLVVEER